MAVADLTATYVDHQNNQKQLNCRVANVNVYGIMKVIVIDLH